MGLGKNIRKARKAAGLTQEELAQAAGIAKISVGQYERGQREPRLEQLLKISKALNVSIYALILPDDPGDPTASLYVEPPQQIAELLELMNEAGQLEALKRVEELAQLDKYKRGWPNDGLD